MLGTRLFCRSRGGEGSRVSAGGRRGGDGFAAWCRDEGEGRE